MIEYAVKLFVPEQDWNEPRMQRLLELGGDSVTLVNDIYSFEKELTEHKTIDKMFNVVALISRTDNCTIAEAMVIVLSRMRDVEKEMLTLVQSIKDDPMFSDDTHVFVDRIIILLGGHHKATTVLDRYNKYTS